MQKTKNRTLKLSVSSNDLTKTQRNDLNVVAEVIAEHYGFTLDSFKEIITEDKHVKKLILSGKKTKEDVISAPMIGFLQMVVDDCAEDEYVLSSFQAFDMLFQAFAALATALDEIYDEKFEKDGEEE